MSIVKPEIIAVYREAQYLASLGIPYRLGGGHPNMLIADGLDCSSAVSRALEWKAHILDSHTALTTWGLEKWGDAGQGTHMTVWVINVKGEIEHVVLEFKVPGWHRWWAGRHTGTTIGFFAGFDPTGYHARHWNLSHTV